MEVVAGFVRFPTKLATNGRWQRPPRQRIHELKKYPIVRAASGLVKVKRIKLT